MDSFLAYGSSDDEEDTITKSTTPEIKPIEISKSNDAKNSQLIKNNEINKTGPKKRRIDISILPKEIQDALTRGVGAHDSDDEEMFGTSKQNVIKASTTIPVDNKNILLNMLPKPKSGFSSEVVSKSNEIEKNNLPVQTSKESHPLLLKVENTQDFSLKRQITENEIDGLDIEEEQDENDNKNGSMFDLGPSTVNSSVNYVPMKVQSAPFAISSAPVTSIPITEISKTSFNDLFESQSLPLTSTSKTQSQLRMNQNESIINNNSRKRNREFEESLLRGDTNAIDSLNATEIETNNEWNVNEYSTRLQHENELKSSYNFGQNGSNNVIIQPNKLQNRRHQINSLAANAQEMEIKLLDSKLARNQGKAQASAKYGW